MCASRRYTAQQLSKGGRALIGHTLPIKHLGCEAVGQVMGY